MGHSIEYFSYPEKKGKNNILNELDAYVRNATWEEGGSGLSSIRWYDAPILNSHDEAMSFLDSNDKGWYDQLAVRYRAVPKGVTTNRLTELEQKYREVSKIYDDLRTKIYVKDFKAEFIGCKRCGSKVNRKYLRSNMCPVCNFDLRSDTVKKTIEDAYKRVLKVEEQIKEEKLKLVNKKADIFWLVKIEYHL